MSKDEQEYDDGGQNDRPIGNWIARYRCFSFEPFHYASSQIGRPSWRPLSGIVAARWIATRGLKLGDCDYFFVLGQSKRATTTSRFILCFVYACRNAS